MRASALCLVTMLPLLLAACATPEQRWEREMAPVRAQPPEFQAGYSDGCRTGYAASGGASVFSKDAVRYSKDSLYRQGWDDGYAVCHSKGVERNRMISAPPQYIYVPSRTKK